MLFTGAQGPSISPPNLSNDQLAKALELARINANKTQHPAFNHDQFSPTENIATVPAANVSNVRNDETLSQLLVTSQGEGGQGQDVTQRCDIQGCSWASFRSSDPSKLETTVMQYKLHLLSVHSMGEGKVAGTSGPPEKDSEKDKALKGFQAATKPRTIVNVTDDAMYNLCEARFFPAPLDNKVLGMKMPICTSPVNTVVDLHHIGLDVTNPDTMRKVQNRSAMNFKLRDFSELNLRAHNAPGDELVAVQHSKDHLYMKRKVHNLDTPVACLKAFNNYSIMARNFHPLDWSSHALLKVALEKFSEGPPTVEMYESLFEKFIHENAVRAQKGAVPLTYEEILNKWNTTLAPSLLESVIAMMKKSSNGVVKPGRDRRDSMKEGGLASPSKRPKLTKEDYCPQFNANPEPPLCSNVQAPGGCINSAGKFLKHACSHKVGKRFCGSDKHNVHGH